MLHSCKLRAPFNFAVMLEEFCRFVDNFAWVWLALAEEEEEEEEEGEEEEGEEEDNLSSVTPPQGKHSSPSVLSFLMMYYMVNCFSIPVSTK